MMSEPKTALVVDDSRLAREMIEALILETRPGWNVLKAESGDDALAKFSSTHFDLATVDLNMPGIDGIECAKQLKEKCPQAKIAVLTANIQQSNRDKVDAIGAQFIAKPVTEKKIVDLIATMGSE